MNRLLGITLSGLLFLGGCAAYDAAKRGEAAMAGGQYDDAVQAYTEAVTLSPDSTK